jgi:hypothetical protein
MKVLRLGLSILEAKARVVSRRRAAGPATGAGRSYLTRQLFIQKFHSVVEALCAPTL